MNFWMLAVISLSIKLDLIFTIFKATNFVHAIVMFFKRTFFDDLQFIFVLLFS